MGVSNEYKAFVSDQLSGLGPVSVRSMFGGGGVFLDGVMFALIADERLYLRASDTTKADFEAEGMGPFTYEKSGKRSIMAYWEVPERLYDEPDELTAWARRAFGIAFEAKQAKPATRSKRAKTRR